MKRNNFIQKSGPYEVYSISQDGRGVRLEILPAFPQYNLSEKEQTDKDIDPSWAKDPRWPIHRYKGEGGGPGIFTAIALAKEFEKFLNQAYSEAEVKAWKDTLAEALKKVRAQDTRRMNRAFAKNRERERGLQEQTGFGSLNLVHDAI